MTNAPENQPGIATNSEDRYLLDLKDAFYEQGKDIFVGFVNTLYPPDVRGRRMPLLHEYFDDEYLEWLNLQEIARRALAVTQKLLPPDSQTVAFEQNMDGAQQRYAELGAKYSPQGSF